MQNIQIPLNTLYTWDISHALTTLYHLYAHKPTALTEYLKRKLQVQHAKHRSHSHSAHIKQNVPLERNTAGPDDKANAWEEANQESTWEDYGLTPAKGFILNDGMDYIPFNIHLPTGELEPAKYIKIERGKDPLIYGMIDGDPHQYIKSFQATPMPSAGPLCAYTPSQLEFFEEKHDLHPEIDEAMHQLYDHGALAKLECFHQNKVALAGDREEECQIQNNIWKRELTLAGCAHRMAGTQILQRIEVITLEQALYLDAGVQTSLRMLILKGG